MLPVYIISDVHLGCNEPEALADREQKLIAFLSSLQGNASKLIINGDFFEFWMEYADYINKHHFSVLCALKNLKDSGVEIHYIAGNHDFNLGSFFTQHLSIITHNDHYIFEYGENKYYVTHGDGLAKSDWKYRIVKKVLRHPLSNVLFKLIHPDWGMALARFVGSTSRYAGKNAHIDTNEYVDAAFDILEKFECDTFIQGHLHHSAHVSNDDKLFVCNNDWLFSTSYIQVDVSGVSLLQWS